MVLDVPPTCQKYLAVELSDELRERAGYLHRGIVPRPAA